MKTSLGGQMASVIPFYIQTLNEYLSTDSPVEAGILPLKLGACRLLALLHQSAGKNWGCMAHCQLPDKGQLPASLFPAVS